MESWTSDEVDAVVRKCMVVLVLNNLQTCTLRVLEVTLKGLALEVFFDNIPLLKRV